MPTTKVSVTKEKLDDLANVISDKSGETIPMTIDEMIDAVEGISTGGTYQTKTVIPTTAQQNVTPDTGYDALSRVTVAPIPSEYIIPTGNISITSNGTSDVTNYANAVVNVTHQKLDMLDVNFYDYDGTILYAYTASDFLALTQMPANPTHPGLIAQGWNWSLSDAKTYVQTNGMLEIGQMYITDDGASRFYIKVTHTGEVIRFRTYHGANAQTLDIDWGDGGEHTTDYRSSTGTSNLVHYYASPGLYTISVTCDTGWWCGAGANSYPMITGDTPSSGSNNRIKDVIKKVEIGSNYIFYLSSMFAYAYGLETITLPNSSQIAAFQSNQFYYCYSLKCVVLPTQMTTIYQTAFSRSAVEHICFPKNMQTIEFSDAFTNCVSLKRLTLPPSINNGSYLPAAAWCSSLTNYICPTDTNITLTLNQTVYSCSSLEKITIPENVTRIVSQSFYQCYGLAEVHLKSTTPPTLDNANAFTSSSCRIYVPSSAVATYKAASVWSSLSSMIYAEP